MLITKLVRAVHLLPIAIIAALAMSGCGSNQPKSDDASPSSSASANSATTKSTGVPPGMDVHGNVINSKLVEAGHGQQVKGLGDWQGEITGKPARDSKFTKLRIGMPMRQVTDLIGQPTDQGAYITGKAFIPFYFGSDRHRHEMVYKGQGRLIFAGGSMGDFASGHLIWIIHFAGETGYR
jgi:hypothetical protein